MNHTALNDMMIWWYGMCKNPAFSFWNKNQLESIGQKQRHNIIIFIFNYLLAHVVLHRLQNVDIWSPLWYMIMTITWLYKIQTELSNVCRVTWIAAMNLGWPCTVFSLQPTTCIVCIPQWCSAVVHVSLVCLVILSANIKILSLWRCLDFDHQVWSNHCLHLTMHQL